MKLQMAVANSAFISTCFPQAGTKNIRYLSFPYGNPQPARRDTRAAELSGNPCAWLLFFSVKGQMVNIWGLVSQNAKPRILHRYLYDKKKKKENILLI